MEKELIGGIDVGTEPSTTTYTNGTTHASTLLELADAMAADEESDFQISAEERAEIAEFEDNQREILARYAASIMALKVKRVEAILTECFIRTGAISGSPELCSDMIEKLSVENEAIMQFNPRGPKQPEGTSNMRLFFGEVHIASWSEMLGTADISNVTYFVDPA